MNYQIEYDKDKDCSSVYEKIRKSPSEALEESEDKKNMSSGVSELRYIFQ